MILGFRCFSLLFHGFPGFSLVFLVLFKALVSYEPVLMSVAWVHLDNELLCADVQVMVSASDPKLEQAQQASFMHAIGVAVEDLIGPQVLWVVDMQLTVKL